MRSIPILRAAKRSSAASKTSNALLSEIAASSKFSEAASTSRCEWRRSGKSVLSEAPRKRRGDGDCEFGSGRVPEVLQRRDLAQPDDRHEWVQIHLAERGIAFIHVAVTSGIT